VFESKTEKNSNLELPISFPLINRYDKKMKWTSPKVLYKRIKRLFFKKPIPFNIHFNSDMDKYRYVTFYDKEPETIRWLKKCNQLSRERVLVDIGANIGIYLLYWLSLNQHNRVIAIEPSPVNFLSLKANIELNKYSDRAILINSAITRTPEYGTFTGDSVSGSASGTWVKKTKESSLMQSLTGDELVNKYVKSDFILKIDVDGDDVNVLKSFHMALMKDSIKSILIELDINEIPAIASYLRTLKYVENREYLKFRHSDTRRIAGQGTVRNRIFDKSL
jgi:FkbM family methyltransferase